MKPTFSRSIDSKGIESAREGVHTTASGLQVEVTHDPVHGTRCVPVKSQGEAPKADPDDNMRADWSDVPALSTAERQRRADQAAAPRANDVPYDDVQ